MPSTTGCSGGLGDDVKTTAPADEPISRPASGSASTLDDVLITDELEGRSARTPNYEAENRALVALAKVMAESPEHVFQALADVALELCQAGSAGVSVWAPGEPENVFRWRGIAGEYAGYLGQTLPRHFSPCGSVLDRDRHLLMADPVRVFPYIADLCAPVREVLLVPFRQGSTPVGTVWVVAHTPHRHFDAEDVRIVANLTRFAEAAIDALDRIEAAKAAEMSFRESEGRYQAFVTATSEVVYRMSPDWSEMRQLVGREFVADTSEPSRSWIESYIPQDDRERVAAAIAAATREARPYELEHQVVRIDGSVGWMASRAIPIRDADGTLTEWFGAASDVTRRRQAEGELRDIRSRIELALEAGAIGTWTWDVPNDRFYVDASLARMFSLPTDMVAGGARLAILLDAIHPDDRDRVAGLVAQAVESGDRYEGDYRVRDGAGGWRWVTARGRVERDETGRAVRFPGVIIDVTDRKRAEEALAKVIAESEQRRRLYEAVLSTTPDLAYVWGLDHRFMYVNEGLLRMWGKTWDEAIGRTCLELGYEPWHAAMHDREIDQIVATRAPIRGEVPFTGTSGRRIYDYLLVPVIGADGEVEAVAGLTRDVTDRKAVEEDLRKQTERQRLLWEAASVLLTNDEPDAMMKAVFARIAGHFGLDTYFNFVVDVADECLRLESCVGVPPATVDSIRRLEFGQAVCGAVALGRKAITKTWIQQSDDPRVQLVKGFGIRAYTCNPLIAGDRLLGTLSFASRTRDEFDLDELEFLRTVCHYVTVAYERLRLVRELREQDRKKDDFIALLAHELRNPLAPIRNGLQVQRMAKNDPVSQERVREIMDRQLGHMVRLIDDLLDVSRINRNKMELRRAEVTLADVVASAVETARPLLDAAGHELTVSLPAAPVILDADLTRLAQVFSNLLTNSAKYTHPGGRIRLSAERSHAHVEIKVHDTGIGIPASSLPTIFDMFSQVDRSIERSSGGLGIGLALVRGLVQMHGGTVTAESPGEARGSTFTVTLPVHVGASAKDAEPDADVSPSAGRRVLVVDDNRDGAESMADMLRLLGYHVATAHDGLQAVEQADAFRPDVVLMDVGMPRMNGLEATRRIRAETWGQSVTIIALTGWGQENDREQTREAGCDAHLVKPVSLQSLQRALSG